MGYSIRTGIKKSILKVPYKQKPPLVDIEVTLVVNKKKKKTKIKGAHGQQSGTTTNCFATRKRHSIRFSWADLKGWHKHKAE